MVITVKDYVAPQNIEEAYSYLSTKKNATLIGGGAFLRMGSKNISLAIDLSKAKLNYIRETEETIEIGSMTTLGEIEQSPILMGVFNHMLAASVEDIVGIQLRNLVTVGGTVYSRYGFSDFITGLLALDTTVHLHQQGILSLEDFLIKGSSQPDILTSIIIKKDKRKASFQSMRNSAGDYAILNLAASKGQGGVRIAVGARPQRAVLAEKTMDYLNQHGLSEEHIQAACHLLSEEISFGTNTRGSQGYRKQIAKVLLKRALEEVVNHENSNEN